MMKQRLRLQMVLALTIFAVACSSSPKKVESAPGGMSEASGREDEALGLNFDLKQKTLSNGLQILVVEDHTVPLISYQTWVNVGSVDERFGLTGIAHLFEHLMFKGSHRFGPRAFFNELEAKGAQVNAFTTRDYTVFHETFIPELLPKVIELESDRLSSLRLDDETLYTERNVVYEERKLRSENSPEGRIQEKLWQLAYRSHPYRWPVIGYEEDLGRVRVDDLHSFFSQYYQPQNVSIVVVGDVNATEIFSAIQAAYGDIPMATRPARKVPKEPIQTEERRETLRDQVNSERIAIAYPSSSALERDTYPLDLLSQILFSGTGSRAHQRFVEEKKIVSSVSGVNYTPVYPGLFMVNASMRAGKKTEVFEKELETMIREVQEKGVTEEELNRAKRQIVVQTVDSLRTAHGMANLIGTVKVVFDDPMRFKEDLKFYDRVTREDVQAVAKKYLLPNRRNIVQLVPGKREEESE